MISVSYTRRFLRDLNKLPSDLQEEVVERIHLFKNPRNHALLKVHKLHGALLGFLSFSVNYRFRIIFEYTDKGKRSAALVTVGDHDIYK